LYHKSIRQLNTLKISLKLKMKISKHLKPQRLIRLRVKNLQGKMKMRMRIMRKNLLLLPKLIILNLNLSKEKMQRFKVLISIVNLTKFEISSLYLKKTKRKKKLRRLSKHSMMRSGKCKKKNIDLSLI
jgi:hypothetical protein